MPRLCLESVAISVEGRDLLSGVELAVEPGERVALVGPSGSGKSTLLRCIAGLADAASGRISLDGRTGDELGWPEWRRRVTYVAQRPVMLDQSVRANLERPLGYRSVRLGGAAEVASEWLARVGLRPEQLDQPARSLSVGEQQRVALLRALGAGAEVMLLDEPTSALDAGSVESVERLVVELTRSGRSALVVTHDAAQTERLGDRCVDVGRFVAR